MSFRILQEFNEMLVNSLGCKDCCANINSLTYLLTIAQVLECAKKMTMNTKSEKSAIRVACRRVRKAGNNRFDSN